MDYDAVITVVKKLVPKLVLIFIENIILNS